jgi:hypothetical protein
MKIQHEYNTLIFEIENQETSYLTTSSILFLYTPSSLSAGNPIAIMFG